MARGGMGSDSVFMIIFVIFAGLLPICCTAAALWGGGGAHPGFPTPASLPPLGSIGWGEERVWEMPLFCSPAVWQTQ